MPEDEMPVDPVARLSAAEIIRLLDLRPHPEGGFFRETFRDPARDARGRSVSTLIYFLLDAGQVSRWQKVDATEVWHFYAGAPLELRISRNGSETSVHRLGPALFAGDYGDEKDGVVKWVCQDLMQNHRLAQVWAYTGGRPVSADFLQKAAEDLCHNLVSGGIRIWARTGDAGSMGGAISYAVSLAGFLRSQSAAC
jgi:ADP-ribose pyrophosphatase YjhB (NUDIX family)